jgi:soluble lytic murein transglycosylase-like protein
MINLNIRIPATPISFYPDDQKSVIKKRLTDIYSQYKKEIDFVSSATKLPANLITSFIFIESNGKVNAVSSAKAVGLMQIIPTSASDILVLENKKGRLTEPEKKILTQKLGSRFTDGVLKMKFLGDKVKVDGVYSSSFVIQKDLFDPLLNILIGSIYLGLLVDEHTEGKDIRLDKVVIRYNRGYFSDNRGKNIVGTLENVIKNVPTESKNYVLKLLGKNGTLDSYFLNIAQ